MLLARKSDCMQADPGESSPEASMSTAAYLTHETAEKERAMELWQRVMKHEAAHVISLKVISWTLPVLSSEGPKDCIWPCATCRLPVKDGAQSKCACFCAGVAQQSGWLPAAAQAAGRPDPALCFRPEGGAGSCSQRGMHLFCSLHFVVSLTLHCLWQGII